MANIFDSNNQPAELPIIDPHTLVKLNRECKKFKDTTDHSNLYSIPESEVEEMAIAITELYEGRFVNPVSCIAYGMADRYLSDNGVTENRTKQINKILEDITKYMIMNDIRVTEWEDQIENVDNKEELESFSEEMERLLNSTDTEDFDSSLDY